MVIRLHRPRRQRGAQRRRPRLPPPRPEPRVQEGAQLRHCQQVNSPQNIIILNYFEFLKCFFFRSDRDVYPEDKNDSHGTRFLQFFLFSLHACGKYVKAKLMCFPQHVCDRRRHRQQQPVHRRHRLRRKPGATAPDPHIDVSKSHSN